MNEGINNEMQYIQQPEERDTRENIKAIHLVRFIRVVFS